MEIEIGDVVLCTVDRIAGTVVFVKISLGSKEIEGSIITAEIAPGRIRNLRDYVVPKKKIVCKVIRVSGERIDLSLRRVTQEERKRVMERYKQEQSYISVLKTVLKEQSEDIIKKILEKEGIYEFLEEAKENPDSLEKITGKENSKKILEILNTQKQKRAVIKKVIFLKTESPDGLSIIKDLLKVRGAEIKYISAGKYSIKTEDTDIKKADNKLKSILKEIEKNARKQGAEFSFK